MLPFLLGKDYHKKIRFQKNYFIPPLTNKESLFETSLLNFIFGLLIVCNMQSLIFDAIVEYLLIEIEVEVKR